MADEEFVAVSPGSSAIMDRGSDAPGVWGPTGMIRVSARKRVNLSWERAEALIMRAGCRFDRREGHVSVVGEAVVCCSG
jgi:hypothetical protein